MKKLDKLLKLTESDCTTVDNDTLEILETANKAYKEIMEKLDSVGISSDEKYCDIQVRIYTDKLKKDDPRLAVFEAIQAIDGVCCVYPEYGLIKISV